MQPNPKLSTLTTADLLAEINARRLIAEDYKAANGAVAATIEAKPRGGPKRSTRAKRVRVSWMSRMQHLLDNTEPGETVVMAEWLDQHGIEDADERQRYYAAVCNPNPHFERVQSGVYKRKDGAA